MSSDYQKEELRKLVELFQANIVQYKSQSYDESNTRTDFIDKFFELLGWDVRNVAGYSEQYRDVVREDRVEIDNRPKAPDYSFRIGGHRKFFVEAKKPSVNIKDDVSPAFQIRRYGYTAKLALSILTDFEEFAVYDTRIKPHKNDKASTARIFYCRFDQYLEKSDFDSFDTNFDYIVGTFSKENILRGSFDRYIEATKNKRGTSEVDKELLALVEEWRLTLAKSIAKQNPTLDDWLLNVAVQRIVDRILFLRIAEDRRIEHYETLFKTTKGSGVYGRLQSIFADADDKYNAGLFKREDWLGKLNVDDKILADIITGLYYPESPYEFSVLPIEILGSIYERFLGKTIILTAGHNAKVEEKPEVRKAGGVYYTPQYIVDYIIRETIGRKLEESQKITAPSVSAGVEAEGIIRRGNTPSLTLRAAVPTITTLDPACGSGSFLVGAYTFLLDTHLACYTDAKNLKKSLKTGVIYEAGKDTYRLSIEEKQRILLASIFGVDIDPIAVEVTKLSLYLKLLEHETEESREMLFRYSDLKMLPNLDNNIRCGNSLIESDFYRNKDMPLFEDYEMRKVNAFDWHKAFPEIFKNGGFDCVVGNPPYSYMISDDMQEYYRRTYKHQDYQKDLYLIFLEKYSTLLKDGGTFGVIVSNTWLLSVMYRKIRTYLTSQYQWHKILHLPDKVFKQAVVDTHILVFDKIKPKKNYKFAVEVWRDDEVHPLHNLRFSDIPKDGSPINITANPKIRKLYDRIMHACRPLKEMCNVFNGVKPFEKGKGTPPQSARVMKEKPFVQEGERPGKDWKPLLRGSLIHRYVNRWNNDYWIQYGPWLAAPRDPVIFDAPEKIMIRQTGDSLIAMLVEKGVIGRDNLHIILNNSELDLRFYLALINSKLMNFIYGVINPEKGEALAQVKKTHVEQLPIPVIDLNNKRQRQIHDRLVTLAGQMLAAQVKLRDAVSDSTRKLAEQRISILDQQIDSLVYELYDISNEEIKIIEAE